jgi:hypothetical protein
VLMQNSFVSAGQDNQTSIIGRDAFHGSPSADNTIGRTEREVVQILSSMKIKFEEVKITCDVNYLMERMARSLSSCIRWFIDQHGMHSANIGSSKAFNMVQNLKIKIVGLIMWKRRKGKQLLTWGSRQNWKRTSS